MEWVVFRPVCVRVDFEQIGWGLLSNLLDIYFAWQQICCLSAPPLIYIYTHAVPYGEAPKLCCKNRSKRGHRTQQGNRNVGGKRRCVEQTWVKNRTKERVCGLSKLGRVLSSLSSYFPSVPVCVCEQQGSVVKPINRRRGNRLGEPGCVWATDLPISSLHSTKPSHRSPNHTSLIWKTRHECTT